eukprot:6486810-Amphidinium_carterae.1
MSPPGSTLHSISCKWLTTMHVVFPFLIGRLFALAILSSALITFGLPSISCAIVGLVTGFGLGLLAEQLSGPTVDRATLQL